MKTKIYSGGSVKTPKPKQPTAKPTAKAKAAKAAKTKAAEAVKTEHVKTPVPEPVKHLYLNL